MDDNWLGLFFRHSAIPRFDKLGQGAVGAVFEDHVDVLAQFKVINHAYDVLMPDILHYIGFELKAFELLLATLIVL